MAYTPVLNPQPIKIPDLATTGTLAALSAVVVTASSSQGIVAIQLTGTWVGTITFQGTEDPLGVTAPSTSWFNVNGVASVSGLQLTNVTANGQFRINAGGYTAVRAIMTVFTSGSATVWINASSASSMATLAEPLPVGTNIIGALTANQSVNNAQISGTAMSVNAGTVDAGTQRVIIASNQTSLPVTVASSAAPNTYAASAPNIATAALATDVFMLIGSATKTISIKKITINGVQTTGGQISILVIKRSTANAGGTAAVITSVPMDSNNAAATGVASSYTANATTLGTAIGNLLSDRIFLPGAATTSDAQGLLYAFGDSGQQMPTLRGVAQSFVINLAGATITGGSLNINVEWQEA